MFFFGGIIHWMKSILFDRTGFLVSLDEKRVERQTPSVRERPQIDTSNRAADPHTKGVCLVIAVILKLLSCVCYRAAQVSRRYHFQS